MPCEGIVGEEVRYDYSLIQCIISNMLANGALYLYIDVNDEALYRCEELKGQLEIQCEA